MAKYMLFLVRRADTRVPPDRPMRRPANPLTQQRTSGDRYDDQHTRLRSSEHPTIEVTPRNLPTQQRTSGTDLTPRNLPKQQRTSGISLLLVTLDRGRASSVE
uniref:Uncharacterized protein n=1 Tax=Anopheles maculatus TaxID=74869 RepID=A0A182S7E8_9DIPT